MFEQIIRNRTDIATIKFRAGDELPAWSITKYIEDTCLIHMKISIIQKICELSINGAGDWRFSVVNESADIFPKSHFSDGNYDDKIIRANKWEDADAFWNIIKAFKRPIVLFELDNGEKIPLNDYDYDEAIKISNLSVNSPFEGILKGLVGPLLDAYQVSAEEQRRKDEHANKQIGHATRNLADTIKTSVLLDNPNLNPGLKRYAENNLFAFIQKQQELNRKIGIETESIDIYL
jgi:hypothetical protein